MKKNRRPQTAAAVMIGILVLAGAAVLWNRFVPTSKRMPAEQYFGSLQEDEAAVVIEDHVAEARAVRIDGQLYLDYALVQSEVNARFYWDESVGQMLFTTAEEIYEIAPERTVYTQGGETRDAGHVIVKQTAQGMYLSLSFLQEHSDFTYEVFEDPDRVVLLFGDRTVRTAEVKRSGAVRYRGGIKSPILTDVERGIRVVVLEQFENWTEVLTPDGYIGYMKRQKLGEAEETRRESVYTGPAYTSLSLPERLNLVWHQINYPEMNANFAADTAAMSGVNVISPTWYFLADSAGAVDSFADAAYVEAAHAAGLQVWALISNFSENVSTTELLRSREARVRVQEYLVNEAGRLGFDGINIDFEGIAEEAGYSYVQFMRELSILCRDRGIYLSVDVPVPMPFSVHYDRAELGTVCDYVIMMGYDEHYAGSDITGSVASMDFEQNGIENMLLEVPKEKTVSAIPFYTRLWYTETLADGSTSVTSEALGMGEAWAVLEEQGVTAVWDDAAGQPYAEWTNAEGKFCQLWLEDDTTVAERASFVSAYDLGGIAAWVLGNELDYVWQVIAEIID